jgi:xanthine dehydrogenase accessory factor
VRAAWLSVVATMSEQAPVVRVVVIRAEGSTPREAGAAMLVTSLGQSGTIGGGALEFDAVKAARALIEETELARGVHWVREVREYPLGPALCQCCGGFAWVLFEVYRPLEQPKLAELAHGMNTSKAFLARQLRTGPPLELYSEVAATGSLPSGAAEEMRAGLSGVEPMVPLLIEGGPSVPAWFIEPVSPPLTRLYLYGAGHVGREVVRVTADLGFDVDWVDTDAARFPTVILDHAQRVIAADPVRVALDAEPHALHLVMTYSHPLDEAICAALLKRDDIAFVGLIGSSTKRARFSHRLLAAGVTRGQLDRLVSPIGIEGLSGKEPAAIAVSVAAQLLQVRQSRALARHGPEKMKTPRSQTTVA